MQGGKYQLTFHHLFHHSFYLFRAFLDLGICLFNGCFFVLDFLGELSQDLLVPEEFFLYVCLLSCYLLCLKVKDFQVPMCMFEVFLKTVKLFFQFNLFLSLLTLCLSGLLSLRFQGHCMRFQLFLPVFGLFERCIQLRHLFGKIPDFLFLGQDTGPSVIGTSA